MLREIVPLEMQDSFLVFDRVKQVFDYPVHYHPEYELNCILNGSGIKRCLGESIETITDHELVLVGPDISHGWKQSDQPKKDMHEITLQFQRDLLCKELLDKTIMKPIKDMLYNSRYGIVFSKDTLILAKPKLLQLSKLSGMDYFLTALSLLHDLAISRNQRLLSAIPGGNDFDEKDIKLKRLTDFVHANFHKSIPLKAAAKELAMGEVTFSRFIKGKTGKTYIEFLNDVRIGYASRYLIEKNENISEIAYKTGFNNLVSFNRTFKKLKGKTPTHFREEFSGIHRTL